MLAEDIPVPKVQDPDDVLVKVKASVISRIDADICRGYGRYIRRLLSKCHSVCVNFYLFNN